MKNKLFVFKLIVSLCIVLNSCKKEESDGPSFKSENNILVCEKFHAEQIKMDGAYVLMHDKKDIYIFKNINDKLKLIQKIGFTEKAGSFCMAVHNGMLAFGRSEALGNGKVFIYRLVNDKWILNQTLEIGRFQDNFGSSLDFNDNLLVIGADARWVDIDGYGNNDDGRVYIFRNDGTEWVQEAELLSNEPFGNNRFGQTVAVYGDFVMAGPWLEIFQYDGTWKSLRTQYDIQAIQIYHDQAYFAISNQNNNYEFKFFKLENDGSFTNTNISGDSQYISSGNQVCMRDNLLAINFPLFSCLIYHFDNNEWTELAEIGTSYEVEILTDLVEISYPYVILSGYITLSQESSIVYLYKQNL